MSKPNEKKGMTTVAITLAVTVVIAMAGFFLGMKLARLPEPSNPSAPPPAEAHEADAGHGSSPNHSAEQPSHPSPHRPGKTVLKALSPIVTNLAGSNSSWIRLEVAIVYDPDAIPRPDVLISQLNADIVAYLRGTSLKSIEGGAGLRRLSEELSERASVRSEGAVQELIIQSLVVQ
ncbi:MAG TPA: flagellar basal body-associated FliL family protein [Methylocystis sp.]|jgi:flagellar basal body-associated protein FliL